MAKESAVRNVFIFFLLKQLFGFGLTSNFFGVFRFDESFQVRKVGLPEHSILLQPLVHSLERFGSKLINPIAPLAPFFDKMGSAQQAQMLGNRRPRDRECPSNLSRRLTSMSQQVEDGPPRGIG
jgi:hypothetical protein